MMGLPISAVLVCVSVLVAGLSWQVLSHIEGKTHESVGNVLHASLQHTQDEITAWVHSRQEDARSWGESAALREKVQTLMDLPPELRNQSPAQDQIWTLLAPMVDRMAYRGVTIVNSHQRVVSSLESHQIGMLHPMSVQQSAFERVFTGESVMGNPLSVGRIWTNDQYLHTMFVAAPMRDDESGMMVAVVFEIDPEDEFSNIAAHGRIGETGETWFFNADGWLISQSRFEQPLLESGQLQAGQSSLLGIQTKQRQASMLGLDASQLYIEESYQQRPIATVRVWIEHLNFGIMSAIDMDEAFAPFVRTKNLVLATVFLIVALLLMLSVFIWLSQQRRHKASEASSLQLRAVLDASPDAILVFDDEAHMVDLNPQASSLFDSIEHEVVQDSFSRFQVFTAEFVQRAKDGHALNIEDEILLTNGLIQPVSIRLRQLPEHHENGSVLVIIQDLTARKHAEDEQQRLEQAQRLESLGVLAGGVAHDFNNILMTVIGNAALIRGRLPDADASLTNLDRIESASRRAADLCKQMLAYSGQGQFVVQTVDLSEQLHEISKLMDVSTAKKIPLTLELSSLMPKCDCDVSQLQQIMLNLVTNANEAIGDAKGRIHVRTGCMDVDEHWLGLAQESEKAEVGAFVYIEVEDDGMGMSEEVQQRIFEPFFTTKFTGRGLGMSAVQGIMRGHCGILFFQSKVEQGSTFRVAFPVSEAYVEVQSDGQVPASVLPHRGMALVVDDESDVRALVCDMLTKLDYEALIAENGKQALEVYALHRDEIEFVLLDLMMPEMNGDECLANLKAMNPEVNIILSSGYSEPLVSSHLSQAKADGIIDDLDFLQKPYDIEQLASSIQRLEK